MKRLLEKIRQMLNKRRTRQILTRVVSIVGALVVFVTTYALVLPAITMEKQAACGIEEHQHDDSCFEEQLICGEEESETHQHTAQCYERVMVCGKPSHVHSTECYQALEESAETESGITESGMGDVTEADPAAATDSTAAETGTADAAADGIDDTGTMEASDTNAGTENGSGTADAEDIDSARGGSETIKESGKTESGVEEDTGFDPVAVPDSSAAKTGTEDAAADGKDDTDTPNASDANADSKNETGKADAKDTDSVRGGSTGNKAADSAEKQKDDSLDSQAGAENGKTSGAGAENSETAADAAEEKNETYAGLEETLDLAEVLTDRTDFYYYPAQYDENGKADTESISSGSVTDWEKVKDNTEIAPADFVRVYLAYTIPAGTLNKNHYTARYRLPGALRLTEDQIEAINKADNGVTRQMEASRDDADASTDAGLKDFPTDAETWRGAEAIEGTRTPDQKLNEGDTEYISATVKVENIYKDGEYQGQDLILTFAPYTVSKNQTTLAADGKTLAEGEKVKGFFALDLTPAQISCDETGSSEIRFAEESDADDTASGLFAHEEILRTLHLQDRTGDTTDGTDADPAEKKENGTETGTEAKDADTDTDTKNTEDQTENTADSKSGTADAKNADGTDADPADQADASKDDKDKFLTGSVIAASGETYEVKVTYDDDAQIPDGSELRVKELLEEDDGYDDYCQQAVEKVEETSVAPADSTNGNDASAAGDNTSAADGTEGQTPAKKSTGYVRVFDIEIWNNDQKIEPSAEVLVEIRLLDAPDNKETNLDVVHFAEDGPEVLAADQNTQDTADTSLEFTTDAFSVYTIVATETLTTQVITADGLTCDITVTYDASANIPENAELQVRDITGEEREKYFDEAVSMLGGNGKILLTNVYAWDISIVADGKEIEPSTPVQVDIEYSNPLDVHDNNAFEVVHFGKNGAETLESELSITSDGATKATFDAEEFSVFLTATPTSTQTGDVRLRAAGATAPEHHKILTPNDDGTYTLSLNVKGSASSDTQNPDANIIIVLDTSNSMINNNAPSGGTRLKNAIDNTSSLALALLENNKPSNTDAVEIALIQFNSDATTLYTPTTDKTKFSVASLTSAVSTHQGTNYEAAMDKVSSINFEDNDPTYVIFLTDGQPTRVTTNWSGISNNQNPNYIDDSNMVSYFGYVAAQKAKALVNSGYELYGIYAYGSEADYLDDLVSYAYGKTYTTRTFQYRYDRRYSRTTYTTWTAASGTSYDSYNTGKYYYAGDTDELEAAIASILTSIQTKIGYEEVKITDGVTDATASTTVHGDTTDFTYTITDPNGNNYEIVLNSNGTIKTINGGTAAVTLTDDADNTLTLRVGDTFPGASNDDGTVTWDIASLGTLLNNYTYTVSFVVWPSQTAYDTIAQCYNEPDYWTNNEAALIAAGYTRAGSGTSADPYVYSLKTNTNATVEYTSVKKVTGQADEKTPGSTSYDDVPSMKLDTTKMTVTKRWEDSLTVAEDRPDSITLFVGYDENGDGVINASDANAEEVTLSDSNSWTETVFIAPGIYVTPGDYKTAASGDNAGVLETGHVYGVNESGYTVDGTFYPGTENHYELESDPIHPMVNGTTTDDTDDLIEFITKTIWADGIAKLTATNTLKGGINITKVIDVDDADKAFVNEDQEFTFTVNLFDESGSPVSTSNPPEASGALGYRVYRADGTTDRGYIENGTVTLTMKASESIRIVNVPSGTYYTVTEGDLSDTVYEFKQSEWLARHKQSADSDTWVTDGTETVTNSQTTNSHQIVMNAENNVTFTNTYNGTGYVATKVWDDGNSVNRPKTISFQLYQKDVGSEDAASTYGDPVIVGVDDSGNALTGTTVVDESTWTYTWKGLPKKASTSGSVVEYEYSFKEVDTPEGYSSVMSDDGKTVTNILAKKVRFVKQETGTTKMLEGAVFTFVLGNETYTLTSDSTGLMKTADGTSEFTMPVSETPYELIETTAPDGYNKLTGKVRVTVGRTNVTAGRSDDNTVTYVVDEPTENEPYYTVHITNSSGVVLPNTGGPGTLFYTLSGIALMLGAALMYGFRMRRRERRLN